MTAVAELPHSQCPCRGQFHTVVLVKYMTQFCGCLGWASPSPVRPSDLNLHHGNFSLASCSRKLLLVKFGIASLADPLMLGPMR